MSTAENALAKYTQVFGELQEHIAANKPVFDAHERIVGRMIDAENDLRDAVAETGVGVSNGQVTVTVTPQTQTVFEEDAIRALSGKGIDVDSLIKVQQRPPRITISKAQG